MVQQQVLHIPIIYHASPQRSAIHKQLWCEHYVGFASTNFNWRFIIQGGWPWSKAGLGKSENLAPQSPHLDVINVRLTNKQSNALSYSLPGYHPHPGNLLLYARCAAPTSAPASVNNVQPSSFPSGQLHQIQYLPSISPWPRNSGAIWPSFFFSSLLPICVDRDSWAFFLWWILRYLLRLQTYYSISFKIPNGPWLNIWAPFL